VSCEFSYVEQYGWALASAAHMFTVYVTVLVAVHRFVYVCRPHDTERLSGLQRAKLHVAAVPLFAFFYNLPRVFEYKLSVSGSGGGGGGDDDDDIMSTVEMTTRDFSGCSDAFATVMSVSRGFKERDKLQFSAVGGSPWFQIAYKNVCFYLFMYIIPLTTLVFVTFRLIATLRMRKNSKYRKSVVASPVTASASATVPPPPPVTMLNRRQQSRDDNVTIVLIIVIAVFIVCQTPTLVQRLLLAVTGIDSRACGHPYYYIERLADYLAIFNSCVNFVVYVIFAPRFRRILVNEVLPMRTTGSSSLTCCCGIGRRGGHRCSRSIGGATACGDNKGRSGTGGSDYCSEMAECFGVSSSQQFDSSAKDNYHQQQQLQNTSVVGLKTVATVAACGRCEATIIADSSNVDRKQIHRLPLTSSSAVGTMDDVDKDEISSSISSAGSSSILPSIQCYGGLCDAVTADHAT
jgi:hypothetical protein